jgi:hypothetical protein
MNETVPPPRFTSQGDPAPDFSHGYLRVPLSVWSSVYCRSPFTRRQLQLLSVVIRESWGWRAPNGGVYLWTRPLTPRQFSTITGLSTDRLGWELRTLVHRSVLREQEGRYQFVPQPHTWLLPARRPVEVTAPAAEMTVRTAEMTATTPALKKAQRRERNVPETEVELSPAGDNHPFASAGRPDLAAVSPTGLAFDAPSFVALLAVLAGPFSARQEQTLRGWLARDGVPVVWQSVASLGLAGPKELPARLSALLARYDREQTQPADPTARETTDA